MNVRIMQCPSCGGSLSPTEIGTFITCNFCGAHLEVLQGASGAPMAKIAEIKADTSFLAKERAKEHLLGRIADMERQIEELKVKGNAEIDEAGESARTTGCGLGIMVFVGGWIVAGMAGWGIDGVLASLALGFLFSLGISAWRRKAATEPIMASYRAKTAELQKTEAALAADVERIQRDLDRLARKI